MRRYLFAIFLAAVAPPAWAQTFADRTGGVTAAGAARTVDGEAMSPSTHPRGTVSGGAASPGSPADASAVGVQEGQTDTKVDASQGGITISSGVNSLTFGARSQFRWTMDDRQRFDADTTGGGVGRADGAFGQFDIPRLRLSLSGGVYRPWMRYALQFELGRTSGEGGSRIKDAILEFRPVGLNYRISLGQFKAPFGLQQLNSTGRLQFVDRAITDAKFNPGRDLGVMVSGRELARRVGYDVGVFNGAGESVRQNNPSHLWAGRVYFQPLGSYALSEGAVDAGETPVLHLGGGLRGGKQIRGRTTPGVIDEVDNQLAWNLELAYKRPRLYATAEYFAMIDEQENPVALPDIDSRGYHVQAAFMAVPRRLEVGILWAEIEGNTSIDDAEVTEARGVVGYFWQGHSLKLQADVGQVAYGARFASLSGRARQGLPAFGTRLVSGRRLADAQLRVQLQLAF